MADGIQVFLDDGTGTFPFELTNMGGKSYVLFPQGFTFSRGRADWQDAVTAGQLTLTLNNADGRFSPGSTIIASPSPIVVDRQIRLKETVNGISYTRFTGYVKAWPVAWPATVTSWSTVQITATDAQARAERQPLLSVIEQEILEDSPVAYYTLGEPAAATSAADSSGSQAALLVQAGTGTAVTFGSATGPATDGLTAASFAAGRYLTGSKLSVGSTPAIIVAFATSSASTMGIWYAGGVSTAGIASDLLILSGGLQVSGGTPVGGAGGYADGRIHVVAVRWTASSFADIIVDGVVTDTHVSVQPPTTQPLIVGADQSGATPFNGTLAHFAVFSTAPSAARLIAQSQAMLTGFAGESGTARLTRTAGYANIPVGTLDTSLTNVAFEDITGRSAWEAIQKVSDAELGAVFIDGTGALTFHNRNKVPLKTAPDLTVDIQYISSAAMPTQDDQRIINYFEATAAGTSVAQVALDATSNAQHGRYPDSKTYLLQSDVEALNRANWIVSIFGTPTTRFGTLTINLMRLSPSQAQAVIAAVEINTWLRIVNMPSQTPGGTQVDVVIEGYAEQRTDKTWTLACNVVSRSLFNAWILGDSTYGVLGTTTIPYV